MTRTAAPIQLHTCVGLCKPARPAANETTPGRRGRRQGLQCEPGACPWAGSHIGPADTARRRRGCQKRRQRQLSGAPSASLTRSGSCQTCPRSLGLASFLNLHLPPGTLQLASGLQGSCQPPRCRVFAWGAGEMLESRLRQGLLLSAKPQEAGISAPPQGDTVQVSEPAGEMGSQLTFLSERFRHVEFAADICAHAGPEAELHLFLTGSVGSSPRALTEFILYSVMTTWEAAVGWTPHRGTELYVLLVVLGAG